MKKEIFGSIVASLMLFESVLVFAQESETVEDEVVVYGVRMVQSGTEVGSSVTVITADDIRALGVDFVVDAIATAPGVTIN
ncbi:MAG: TonB-dependent receptor plug domain-containing protein, partial [Woeseiales bacterium]